MKTPFRIFPILLAIALSACDPGDPPPGPTGSGGGGGGSSSANPCVPGSGPTLHSATVTGDETWTAAASPHRITSDLGISASGTVRLEPCVELQIAPGIGVTVSGRFFAEGTADRPIRITSTVPGQNWAYLRVYPPGRMRLAHATLEGGGNPLNITPFNTGALDVRGDQTQPTQPVLHVENVTIRGSASQGVYLHEGGGFTPESSGLTITGAAGFPIHTWSRAVSTIPPGSYTGNATDEILIPGGVQFDVISESATMRDRGVPYRIGGTLGSYNLGGDLRVVAPAAGVTTLTIEPGVKLRFAKNAVLHVDFGSTSDPSRASLVAVGTPDKPIVFTSAEAAPAPGDWRGLYLWSTVNAGARLDHVVVEYAGGGNSTGSYSCPYPNGGVNTAAIRILGGKAPPAQLITHTTIRHSLVHGIDRGWADEVKPDFLATNTFEGIGRCKQTYPKDSNLGGCAPAPPCP